MNVDFVDVSVYQGDIDWPAVTVPAVIKATEGSTFTDPKFVQNRTAARAAGKCAGWYHFLASTSPGDAQAHHFLDTVQPDPDELLCLDWETDSIGVRPDPDQASTWIDTVRERGHGNIRLYGNAWAGPYAHQWDVPFWCAWYGNAEQQVRACGAVAWQWSSSEYVPGIPSRVDVNQILDPDRWLGDDVMTPEQFAAMLGPIDRCRAIEGVVHINLKKEDGSDDGWWPVSDVLEFTHRHIKSIDGA